MMDRADFETSELPSAGVTLKDEKPVEAPNTLPDSGLRLITLDLARCADFPTGSVRHGYSFVAPLTADGHLDSMA